MSDAIALRNRFAMVKGAWDENLRGVPFPSLGDGTAEEKIERLELALVDEMRARATPETAEQAADAMWGLVHARPDTDPVKQRVTQHHEDGIEDGHEVMFQTDVPKHEYQYFLASWLTGTPSVPADASRDAPCP